MRPWIGSFIVTLALALAGIARANEAAHADHSESAGAAHEAAHHATEEDTFPHPSVSHDGSWAGVMAIIILLGFFLPAAVIGPIIRANTPEEVPPAHSHDEPPGASHHHGHGGTHAEEPHH